MPKETLMEVMNDELLKCIVQKITMSLQLYIIQTDRDQSSFTSVVTRGGQQRSSQSPTLFNVYMDI